MNCASWNGVNNGCEGGNPTAVFDWAIQNKGFATWSEYPYKNKKESCVKTNNVVGHPTKYK
jgi:Papain family cysteine protease